MRRNKEELYEHLPETPGVYLMKDAAGEPLYIGKAANLKRRVSSYFLKPHDARLERLVERIAKIDYKSTDSALEALILESALIKKWEPPFNIREKDDKSFLYVGVTKETFPRILLLRGKELENRRAPHLRSVHGPFVSSSSAREALRVMRRIFPWNTHPPEKAGKMKRPCFDYGIGLCPGTCVGAVGRREYMHTVRSVERFFSGEKKKIISELEHEMRRASKRLEFEKAEKIKRRLFALRHIQETALLSEENFKIQTADVEPQITKRIEGYDISNISGTDPVGSMVVFVGTRQSAGRKKEAAVWTHDKSQYRKFIIKTVEGSNDVAMLREVLERRFSHAPEEKGWIYPDVVLVDGGKGQVNAAKAVLAEKKINIPVLGIAKGPERKRNDIIGKRPEWVSERTLERVRDEAHRFAIAFHRKRRSASFLKEA